MNDVQEINVDALMAQIRENLPSQHHTPAVGATTPVSNGLMAAELSSLQSSREIRYFHLTSHRQFLGSFVLLAKKAVRKLLTPSLERQSAYNTANIRLTAHLCERAEALQKFSQELGEQSKEFRQELIVQLGEVRQELTVQLGEVRQELTAQLREVRQELTAQLREVRHELTEQAEQRYQELGEQIGGLHQEHEAALQAMRLELAEQIGDLHQEQAGAGHAIRGELTEQIASLHGDQAGARRD
jgi:DNA anti-recombination protein RmuC